MEYTANVRTANGTESVTIRASSKEYAIQKLLQLGYKAVNWIL